MSTLLTINVENNESTQGFYVFQQQAIYTGGSQVYSNSLFSQTLENYDASGSVLTFQVNLQYYAGIQQTHGAPAIGQSSGFSSASRAIDLASASGSSDKDWTTASVNPLGLTMPRPGIGVQPGAFRITTPLYGGPDIYNVGSAVEVNGGIVLSNFVVATPSSDTDCQPVFVYYVQTGNYPPGSVMNFTQSSVTAAMCDFTGGHSVIDVTLNQDGTWTTRCGD